MNFFKNFIATRWLSGLTGNATMQATQATKASQAFVQGSPLRSRMLSYDQALAWVVIGLLTLGLVMVYSTTINFPDSTRYNHSESFFLIRHALSLVMALIAGLITFRIPIKTLNHWAPTFFIFSFLLLVLVLIPHIGKGVNGSRRWISLGFLNFQPTEMMKLAVALYAANYTVRKQEFMQNFRKGFVPMAFAIALIGALVLLEPDMGGFVVIALIATAVLFLGGINGKIFGGLY